MTAPTEAMPGIREGDIIGGKYRVERVIGQGGMGTVVRARHTLLEQHVAIKVLASELASDPQYATRFLREAQTAVSIKGEHVVRVLDVGTQEGGAPYMVMEYLEGKDLGAIVDESGQMPIADSVDYVLQACEALAEAHVAGLTHRDIKPSNLFLARRSDGSPLVKLLDFGIAKPSSTTDNRLTTTGTSMGSPSYMSPEQVRNAKTVDSRSDIWSLGATLHEMLTGLPPFVADTFPALCAAIIADSPTPLCQAKPEAPAELESIIAKCLEKKPDDRYADVGALARALAPFGGEPARISVERITKIITPGAIPALPAPPPRAVPGAMPREMPRAMIASAPAINPAAAFAATAVSTSVSVPAAEQPKRRSPAAFAIAGIVALLAIGGVFLTLQDKPAETKKSAVGSSPGKDSVVKSSSTPGSTAEPVIIPAGVASVLAPVVASAAPEASSIATVPASSTAIIPTATSARPVSKTGPTSTKKTPTYDPFADQH